MKTNIKYLKSCLGVLASVLVLFAIFGLGLSLPALNLYYSTKRMEQSKNWSGESFPKEPNFTSAGVVVYGGDSPCWIKNTNNFPVKIQMVQIIHGAGVRHSKDTTRWIQTFEANQIKKIEFHDDVGYARGLIFHIYDMEGKQIGFIVLQNPRVEQ